MNINEIARSILFRFRRPWYGHTSYSCNTCRSDVFDLGHSNKIHCFPFPARIIFSLRMLSFIIWSYDENFHYCDWARFAEHSKSRLWTSLVHVCQPSGLRFCWILLALENRSAPFMTFVWILWCIPSTSEFSCTVQNILDLPLFQSLIHLEGPEIFCLACFSCAYNQCLWLWHFATTWHARIGIMQGRRKVNEISPAH